MPSYTSKNAGTAAVMSPGGVGLSGIPCATISSSAA